MTGNDDDSDGKNGQEDTQPGKPAISPAFFARLNDSKRIAAEGRRSANPTERMKRVPPPPMVPTEHKQFDALGWTLVLPGSVERHDADNRVRFVDVETNVTWFVERRGDGKARMRVLPTVMEIARQSGAEDLSNTQRGEFAGNYAPLLTVTVADNYWAAYGLFLRGYNYAVGVTAPQSSRTEAKRALQNLADRTRPSAA